VFAVEELQHHTIVAAFLLAYASREGVYVAVCVLRFACCSVCSAASVLQQVVCNVFVAVCVLQ